MDPIYLEAFMFVLGNEGGDYHPTPTSHDQNPTRKGVTQNAYDAHRKARGRVPQSVFLMDDVECAEIYQHYWDDAHCGELPRLVAISMLDMSINGGPSRAIKEFQESQGLVGDGKWGPLTAQKAYACRQDEVRAVNRLNTQRLGFYVDIGDTPEELQELRSWIRRIVKFNLKYLQ